MRAIPGHLLGQISGGGDVEQRPTLAAWHEGGGGFDSWDGGDGGGFDSSGGGGGFESTWEGSGGFESGAGAGSWSLEAIGIEGGEMAVVRITAADAPGIPVFENTQPVASYGPGEAPWEGRYLGQWVEPAPPSYGHTAVDGALIANTGRLAGTAAAAIIEGALTGAEIGAATANPVGILGGLVIGTAAAAGAYYLLQNDHETGAFVAIP